MTPHPEENIDNEIDLDAPISASTATDIRKRRSRNTKSPTKGNHYLWLVVAAGGLSFFGLGIAYYTLHQFNKEQYTWEAKSELRDTLQAEIEEQRDLLPKLSAEISGKNEERSLKLDELTETKARLDNARNNLSETQKLEGEVSQSYQVLVGKENVLRGVKEELEKENTDLTLVKSKLEAEKDVTESSLINLQSEQERLKVLTAGSRNGLASIESSVRENRETFNRESKELSLLQSSLADAKLVEAEYSQNRERSG
jgi:chromosome segregation ATPase